MESGSCWGWGAGVRGSVVGGDAVDSGYTRTTGDGRGGWAFGLVAGAGLGQGL